MSTTIDNRVVSMEFDNAKFEKNVEQSLDTLKNLDNTLNGMADSANRFNSISFDSLADRIDDLASNFTFLGTLTRKVFEEISEGIINITQKIANISFSGISAGWQKYGEKTSAVQQIMAATGRSIEDVNASLERLNWYTDETSYDFVAMTGNIAKFTSQNIGLEQAEAAMEGIANWAASAGQRAETASRAMYNISQSLGAGYMQAIDWRSIELANMATASFKQVAIDTGLALGTLKKNAKGVAETVKGTEVTVSNCRDSLKDKWFDTNVMTSVFEQYSRFNNVISEMVDTTGLTTSELLRFAEAMADGKTETSELVKELGLSSETINKYKDYVSQLNDEQYKLSREAFKMAQEATTFKDAIDAFNDAYSTAWMNVFEIIFGNYEKARKLWTDLANTLYDIFVEPVNSLIDILDRGLGSSLGNFESKITDAGISINDFVNFFKSMAKSEGLLTDEQINSISTFDDVVKSGVFNLETYKKTLDNLIESGSTAPTTFKDSAEAVSKLNDVVMQIWRGDFGNGEARKKALMEAGFNYDEIQNLVNKVIDGYEISEKDLSDTWLKSIGYTEEQIAALKELRDGADDVADEFEKMNRVSGGEHLQNGYRNIMNGILALIQNVKDAWNEVFNEDAAEKVYQIAEKFDTLTTSFKNFATQNERIKKILTQLFTLFKNVKKIAGKVVQAFSPVKDIIKELIGATTDGSTEILNIANNFLEWFNNSELLRTSLAVVTQVLKWLCSGIKRAVNFVKNMYDEGKKFYNTYSGPVKNSINGFIEELKKFETVQKVITWFQNLKTELKEFGLLSTLRTEFEKLINKLKEYQIVQDIITMFDDLVTKIGELQIVKEAQAWFDDLFNGGLDENATTLDKLANAFVKIKDAISGFATALTTNYVGSIKSAFSKMNLESTTLKFSEAFKGIGTTLSNFAKTGDGTAFLEDIKSRFDSLKQSTDPLAEALSSLKGSFDFSKLGFLAGIAGTIVVLSKLTKAIQAFSGLFKLRDAFAGLLNSISSGIKAMINNVKYNAVIKVALAIGILVAAVAALCILSKNEYDVDGAVNNLLKVAGALAVIMIIMTVMSAIANHGKAGGASVVKGIMSLVSATAAIILLAGALYVLAQMDLSGLSAGKIILLIGAVVAMILLTKIIKGVSKDALRGAYALIAVAIAVAAAAGAIWLIGQLDLSLSKDAIMSLIVVVGLMAVLGLAAKGITFGNGIGLLSFVLAILAFEKVLQKILDNAIPYEKIKEHLKELIAIIAIMAAFSLVSRLGGKNSWSGGIAIALMAVSFFVVGKAIEKLGSIDTETLIKGGAVIAILSLVFAVVMACSKSLAGFNKSGVAAMIAIVVAIGLLLASVVALTMFGDIDKIMMVCVGIVAILIGLALIFNQVGKIKANPVALAEIGFITVLVGGLAVLMMHLAKMDNPEKFVAIANGMAALILALGVAVTILSYQKSDAVNIKTVLLNLLTMAGMLVLVMAALIVVSKHDIQNGIEIALAMSLMLVALGGAVALANLAPAFNPNAGKNLLIGSLALIPIAAALIAMDEMIQNPEKLLNSVLAIGAMMVALSAVMVLLGAIPVDMKQVAGMLGIMIVFTTVMAAIIGGLSEWKTMLEAVDIEDMKRVGAILVETMAIIGEMIGQFVGSLFIGLTNDLYKIGENLEKFAESLKPFLETMGGLGEDQDTSAGLDVIAGLIPSMLKLQQLDDITVDFITISDIFTGLGVCLANFSASLSGIKFVNVSAASKALEAMSGFIEACPTTGGFVQFFTGSKDTKSFGEGIEAIGTGLSTFLESIPEDIGEKDLERVAVFNKIFNSIIEVSKNIENSGGLAGAIMGNNDIDDFAKMMLDSFPKIMGFMAKLKRHEDLFKETSLVDNYSEVINKVVSCTHDIENSGGALGYVVGNNDIDDFVTMVDNSTTPLVQMLRKVKLASALFENDAPYLDGFINVINKIKDIPAKISGGLAGTDIQTLFTQLGTGFTDLSTGLTNLSTATTSAEKVVVALGQISEKLDSISTMKFTIIEDSLKTALGLDEIDLTDEGQQLVFQLAEGMISWSDNISSAVVCLMEEGRSKIESYWTTYYNAGAYMIDGIIRGIESQYDTVYQACWNIALKAIEGAKAGCDEDSPSKAFYEIGDFMGQGLVLGINNQNDKVESAAEYMASNAVDSVTEMVNAIQNAINSENDLTITPVLDLTNVKSGASELSSILNSNSDLQISKNVGSVSGLVSKAKEIQNGSGLSNVMSLDQSTIDAIKSQSINVNSTVKFEGSLSQLAAVLQPAIVTETNRRGPSLIS